MFGLLRARERGQVLVLFAVTIPMLLGMTGMAVDLGAYATERRDLQNAADSAALAAARELPDAAAAEAAARSWGVKNDIDPNDISISVTGGSTAPRVRVEIERPHEFVFMRIVGLDEKDVSGAAASIKASLGGDAGIVPWSITQETVDWALAQPPATEVVLKYDPDGAENGNFGAIRIDGTGSDVYGDAVKYGSETFMCSIAAPNCSSGACPGTYPDACAETSPECDGAECDPQTGNLVGKTREGVEYRLDNTKDECDTFEETFSGPDANGKYTIDQDCNPFASGGACPEPDTIPPAECSRQVLLIPVIDEFGNGTSDAVTVQRFAMVYLVGLGNCESSGQGHCEVRAIFVKADITTNSLAGIYDEDASVHFTKLVE